LTNNSEKLQHTAAMLLSNLFTNDKARSKARSLNWMGPVMQLLNSSNLEIVTQIVRVIVNITFDESCRFQLVKNGAERSLNAADQKFRNPNLSNLITSALRNLSVPVSDSIGGGSSGGSSTYKPPQSTPTSKPQSNNLDDILNDISSSSTVKSSTTVTPPRNSVTNTPPRNTVTNPPPSTNTRTSVMSNNTKPKSNDFDDILSDISSLNVKSSVTVNPPLPPRNSTPTNMKSSTNDLDDILNDISSLNVNIKSSVSVNPPPPPPPSNDFNFSTTSTYVPPSNDRPITQRVSVAYKNDFDDIDALISGMSDNDFDKPKDNFGMPSKVEKSNLSDIDDLLSEIETKATTPTTTVSVEKTKRVSNLDDIDDILADLNTKPSSKSNTTVRSSTAADLDAIDDLLADLTL